MACAMWQCAYKHDLIAKMDGIFIAVYGLSICVAVRLGVHKGNNLYLSQANMDGV